MKILTDENGQAVITLAAFMGLVALGFLAFGVEVGSLFRERRMAQAAADSAAIAAAEELATNNPGNEQNVANAMATMNGFDTTLATNPATVTLQTPTSGNFTGSAYVQVTVSKPISTTFLGAFAHSMALMPVSAQATAGAKGSQTCVCLEGNSGQNINLSGGSRLSASGCGIVSDSSSSNAIGIVGGSLLSGATLGTVSSTWNNASNINNGGSISSTTTIVQGITSQCTPALPPPPSYSTCLPDPGGSYGTYTWGPATSSGTVCYTSLTIGANSSSDTLNPGIYVISSGNLHFESGSGGHSNFGGNGVFFYLTGSAALIIDNGANVNLVAGGGSLAGGGTAPDLGAYNGIVVYQASSDTTSMSLEGGATGYLNGSLYAPAAPITIGNGATLNAGIVANSLILTGGATLNATTNTNEGSLAVGSAKLVQ